ncbi:hypothetical protein RJ639_046776 [Escallonia herrerae]|uniref:TF-B3 domain-containing protein n=1 Tax=Escallonia herrerae TaxID=1293975 RepID=A0AA88WBG9_9ASTE|nr:hypothetical protein RJ639_046776 [Escallonia herrerae]
MAKPTPKPTSSSRHEGLVSSAFYSNTTTTFSLSINQEESAHEVQKNLMHGKEAMFEKQLTPSDVGKLNRLVIPKQQAEKHFPFNGGSGGENGQLLSFEDETGHSWRFRYSYWSSSQSYVLTKGWSRFIKEKHLSAGDTVLFERHRVIADRLFIRLKRSSAATPLDNSGAAQPAAVVANDTTSGGGSDRGGDGWTSVYSNAHTHCHGPSDHCLPAESNRKMPSGNSRTLIRLFGVNMEYEQADEFRPPR